MCVGGKKGGVWVKSLLFEFQVKFLGVEYRARNKDWSFCVSMAT